MAVKFIACITPQINTHATYTIKRNSISRYGSIVCTGWLSNETNDEYSALHLKSYLMALSDCYDCELDFVKKEILHTRSVFEGTLDKLVH